MLTVNNLEAHHGNCLTSIGLPYCSQLQSSGYLPLCKQLNLL